MTRARALRRGFTLIEVLVAVAILAIALGAIIVSMGRYAEQSGSLRERTLALWVAHNRLTDIGLLPDAPSVGRSDGDMEMGGIRWRWFVVVKPTTMVPTLRQVEIRIQRRDVPQDIISLTTYVTTVGREGEGDGEDGP